MEVELLKIAFAGWRYTPFSHCPLVHISSPLFPSLLPFSISSPLEQRKSVKEKQMMRLRDGSCTCTLMALHTGTMKIEQVMCFDFGYGYRFLETSRCRGQGRRYCPIAQPACRSGITNSRLFHHRPFLSQVVSLVIFGPKRVQPRIDCSVLLPCCRVYQPIRIKTL